MTTALLQMIRDRHNGMGWAVVEEMPSGTGGGTRRLDALAMGLWPSNQFVIHGFEIKISRSDLKRELVDPTKSHDIGRFCDYFWLVVSDAELTKELVIPEAWGVLAPGAGRSSGSLRTVRKAQKLKPQAPTRGFLAALLRKVMADYVPTSKHTALRESIQEKIREGVKTWQANNASADERRLATIVEEFTKHSGIDLEKVNRYELDDLGAAVKVVMEARKARRGMKDWSKNLDAYNEPVALLDREIAEMETRESAHKDAIAGTKIARQRLREIRDRLVSEAAAKLPDHGARGEGAEAPIVANGNDDPGGGIDRGDPREDLEDAGPVVRDIRD